jgi:hypothetical protein
MNREVSRSDPKENVTLDAQYFFYGIAKSFYSLDLCSALYMIIKSAFDPY